VAAVIHQTQESLVVDHLEDQINLEILGAQLVGLHEKHLEECQVMQQNQGQVRAQDHLAEVLDGHLEAAIILRQEVIQEAMQTEEYPVVL
jgi:hypothetical protein